jgi:uncharacterized protein YhjY with autotransporter beta-barrel domain
MIEPYRPNLPAVRHEDVTWTCYKPVMHFELRARAITLLSAVMLTTAAGAAHAQSTPVAVTTPNVINVAGPTQVTVDGQTFVNIGLVGMGRIAAGTPDFNHDSLGAFSGMDINLSTWRKTATGYTGGLFGLPDRGPNGIGNVTFSDYAGRLNSYSMAFTPYTGAANLPAATSSQNQLVLTQTGGFFLRDFNGNVTTGFDPGTGAASAITQNGIQLPGLATGPAAGKISLDAEGVRFLRDRSFYISDEYGANVYYFDATGRLQGVIRPPAALLPRDATGALSYSSLVDPATGRRPNQGIEGMAITPDGKKLVTLGQSATIQDSTGNQQDRTNTRLMIYDISTTKTPTTPIADYVMQLPIYTLNGAGGAPNRTAAQSELLALNGTQFLVLSRDALGLGLTTGNSVFKSVLLVDTSGATNIAGTNFETTATPISPGGVLNSTLRPVQQFQLVNMLNATQLTKFGENLNNVTPNRLTLGEKWEGMALAPVLEENAPQDFFLFVGNDNDFLSTTCRVNNEDCSQAVDSDSHVMIFRLTLPTYVDPEYLAAMVSSGPFALALLGQSAAEVASSNLDNIAAHMDAVRRTGFKSERASVWVSGLYDRNDWNDFPSGGGGASTSGVRGTFGVDVGVGNRLTVGATLGYGESNARSDSEFRAKTTGYSYGATARYADRHVFVNAAYARGDYDAKDITRPAAYGLTALGATDARSDGVLIEAAYAFGAGVARLSPIFRYRYMRNTFGNYTETGAAGGNVAVPDYRFNTNLGIVGAEASFNWRKMIPVFQATYNVTSSGDPRLVTLKLASASAAMASEAVTIPGTDEDFVSVGAGLQRAVGQGLWHVGYAAAFGRTDRVSQTFSAGIGFKF